MLGNREKRNRLNVKVRECRNSANAWGISDDLGRENSKQGLQKTKGKEAYLITNLEACETCTRDIVNTRRENVNKV